MGRHFRTTLTTLQRAGAKLAQPRPGHWGQAGPTQTWSLGPSWPNPDLGRQKNYDAKQSYQFHLNRRRGLQSLLSLCPGDMVTVKNDFHKN